MSGKKNKDNKSSESVFVSSLAGGLASLVTEFLYFPLDTLKTRL